MAKNPLVTIVIQTYNRRDLLPSALESAKNQTYKNIEILIGDNHSEDETEKYCTEEAKNDTRIKYFRHKENIGMVGNANFLLDRVSGEYFIFLNDDDWLDLDYVEKCIEFIKDKPDYSMVCPSTVLYSMLADGTFNKFGAKCRVVKLNNNNVFKRLKEYLINQDVIEMSSGCFRTSILRKIKKTEGQYIVDRYNEDIILEMKFLASGKCKVLSKTHINKRQNGFSRDLITCHKVYSSQDITLKNLAKKRCVIFSEAILNDNYFSAALGRKNAKKLSRKIYLALEDFYCVGRFTFKKLLYRVLSTIYILYNYRLLR